MEIDKILGTDKKLGSGIMGASGDGCQHNWKIFNDTKLKGTEQVSFYCTKCKALSKRKVEYQKEE